MFPTIKFYIKIDVLLLQQLYYEAEDVSWLSKVWLKLLGILSWEAHKQQLCVDQAVSQVLLNIKIRLFLAFLHHLFFWLKVQ